jgi:isopenicillin N synthase-like dioxygenase
VLSPLAHSAPFSTHNSHAHQPGSPPVEALACYQLCDAQKSGSTSDGRTHLKKMLCTDHKPPPLPTIDVSPFLSLETASSPEAQACATAIRAAFTSPGGAGFFYATGHGIPPETMDAAFDALGAFFGAPQAVKDALAAANSPLYRGYVGAGSLAHSCAPGQDSAGKEATGDAKESMTVGMEAPASPGSPSPMHGPNQWPGEQDVPGFEGAVRAYVAAGLRAATAVARATAAALGQAPDWFDPSLTDPVAQLVMLRYPGVAAGGGAGGGGAGAGGEASDTPAGCGAHTDCGLITLVAQRGPPGLQVAMRPEEGGEGEGGAAATPPPRWVTAPPVPGTLVVNFGDLAAFWSGGAIASTIHRVLSPPLGSLPRESVILFANARFDAEVVAGGAAVVGGGAGQLTRGAKTTTAGRYMLEKLGLMWLAEGKET